MPHKSPADRRAYQNLRNQRRKAVAPAPLPPSVPVNDAAEVFFSWAESTLKVPTGPLRGRPFRIPAWQRHYIREALADGVREAGLSIARKNGKSGLIAALMLCYLVGPLNSEYWRGLVVSLTGNLAKELRDAIAFTAEVSGLAKSIRVFKSPPPGRIEGLRGARLDILASDRASGHAVGGDVCVIDEAGLLEESERDLWAAVASSLSGRDGRLLAISIRGDGPMFAEMAERADGKAVRFIEHAAPPDAALDDVSAWCAANPGIADGIKSRSYMVDAAAKALASPGDQAKFKSFDLNLPQAPSRALIVSLSDWLACVVAPDDLPPRAGEVCVGFDIGGSSSMTCAVALWPRTGRLEVFAAFGDTPSLEERSQADKTPYVEMLRRGELTLYPGRVTPATRFLQDVALRLEGERVVAVGGDRYRKSDVLDALGPVDDIRGWPPIQWRIMGKGPDGSTDVRAFQRMVLAEKIRCRESMLMASAIAESSVKYDSNGNEGLDKSRQHGRIDALSAGIIACGEAEHVIARPSRKARSFTL